MTYPYHTPNAYDGIPIQANPSARRGSVYVIGEPPTIVMHPIELMYYTHIGEIDWQWENIYEGKIVKPLLNKFDQLIYLLELENIQSELDRVKWELDKIKEEQASKQQARRRIKRFRVGPDDGYSYHRLLDSVVD